MKKEERQALSESLHVIKDLTVKCARGAFGHPRLSEADEELMRSHGEAVVDMLDIARRMAKKYIKKK